MDKIKQRMTIKQVAAAAGSNYELARKWSVYLLDTPLVERQKKSTRLRVLPHVVKLVKSKVGKHGPASVPEPERVYRLYESWDLFAKITDDEKKVRKIAAEMKLEPALVLEQCVQIGLITIKGE